MIYFGESGALNETFSDMWGEWVDQNNGDGNDTPEVKWLLGEDTRDGVVRNMANPPDYNDPDRRNSPLWINTDPGGYVLLHSLAHVLMRQFSLECGYTAAISCFITPLTAMTS